MRKLSRYLAGAMAATALAVAGIAPGQAKAADGHGWGRDHHHRDPYRHGPGHRVHPDQAVRICARAAEREASRYGPGRADVTRITGISRKQGGYNVKGHILVNSRGWGWRHHGLDRGKFTCRLRYGQVADISFSGLRGYY